MSTHPFSIRPATPADAESILEIYRPYVSDSSATFEADPPTLEQMQQRVEQANTNWVWTVAESNGEVLGYAYAGTHRARYAYRFSVETSVYLSTSQSGRGIGTALYQDLLSRLKTLGYKQAFAGITMPNAASVGLHQKVGFRFIGMFPKIGWKFGRWHDVAWWYLELDDNAPQDAG